MKNKTVIYVNMSDVREAQMLYSEIARLRGDQKFTIEDCRPTRSLKANAYYWACYVNPVARFLREHGQNVTPEEVHIGWRLMFLKHPVLNPDTGEILFDAVPGSTTNLDDQEFSEYLEFIANWMSEKLGFVPPPPTIFHREIKAQMEQEQRSAKAEKEGVS